MGNIDVKKPSLNRTHRICIMLNDEEKRHIEYYVKKYRVSSTSRFIRETAIKAILQRLYEDSPTLFD
jgi:hypothetical protein